MQPPSVLGLRLSALSAAVFLGLGFHLPFFPVFLASLGFDAPTVGLLLAAPVFVRVVATPLVTSLGDRHFAPATLLVVMHLGLAVTYFAMAFAQGFWTALLLNMLTGLLHGATVPLSDMVIMRDQARQPALTYGRVRVWGSVSFMAGNIAGGAGVAFWGPGSVVFMISASCLLAAAVATLQTRRVEAAAETRGDMETAGGRLLPPVTILILAGIALSHASHAGLNGFGTLDWQRQGLGVEVIGVLWAVSFVAEMAVFWRVGALVTRLDTALAMLAVAAGVGIVRWMAMASGPGLALSALLQALHAVTFGFTHLAGLAAVAVLAPPGRRGTLMGLTAGAGALASALAMLVSGELYAVSPASLFLAMAGVSAGALACFALVWLMRRP